MEKQSSASSSDSDQPGGPAPQTNEVLEHAVAKVVMVGAKLGVTVDEMIEFLDSGMTVEQLLEYVLEVPGDCLAEQRTGASRKSGFATSSPAKLRGEKEGCHESKTD